MRELNIIEKQIIELDELLQSFDFYYESSNDEKYVESYASIRSRIRFLLKKINDYSVTTRIWNKYAPFELQKVETNPIKLQ